MLENAVQGALGNTFALAAVATLCLLLFGSAVLKRNASPRFPRYEVSGDTKKTEFPTISSAMHEAYPKFRNAVFQLGGIWKDVIIIPPSFIEGLKSLPENQLSFVQQNKDKFMSNHTMMRVSGDPHGKSIINSISVDLTRHLNKIMKELDSEIQHGFSECFPACDDWTEVFPAQSLVRLVALASGRIFVGSNLNRNEEFLKCTIMFTIDAFMGAEDLRKYPTWTHWIMKYFNSHLKNARTSLVVMKRIMEPLIEERMQKLKAGEPVPSDMISWMINNAPPGRSFDVEFQAHCQLMVSLAAIHTTSMQSSHVWFDLAAHPEYISDLRHEIEEIRAGEPDGYLSKTSMPRLKKLDSFLKESQRLNPLGALTFERKVTSDLTLPDGTTIPKGSMIGAATQEIARDPQLWKDPENFDGFRFEKLRQVAGNENRYQFVTTGINSMQFGHGKHACPGRFFAANEIKLILVRLITDYDVKLPEGEGRPKNIEAFSGVRPDHEKAILMKRRVV